MESALPSPGSDPDVARARSGAPRAPWRTAGWVLLVAAVLALTVWQGLRPDATAPYLAVNLGVPLLALLAVLAVWWRRPAAGMVVPFLVAVGVVASGVGDVVWEIYVVVSGQAPDVSWADPGWLVAYVLIALALVRVQADRLVQLRRRPDALIDMGVVIVIASLVVWLLWVGPTVTDASTPLGIRTVWALYPVLDAALLGLLVRMLVDRTRLSGAGLPLAVGLACWLASDLGFLVLGEDTVHARYMNAGWMLGSALLALAAWRLASPRALELIGGPRAVEAPPDPTVVEHAGAARVALVVAPLLVPWAIELAGRLSGNAVDPVPLFIAAVLLTGLVCLRLLHLFHVARTAQDELGAKERLAQAIAANSSDAVLLLDRHGVLMSDAPGLGPVFGEAVIVEPGTDLLGLAHGLGEVGEGIVALFDRSLASPGVPQEDEFVIAHADGRPVWTAARVVNLLDDPDVRGIIATLHDVTGRKTAEEQLAHQAFHDSLTGLANRELLRDRLEHALQQAERTGIRPAVLYVDLDGFKHVNDSLGHDTGDDLLREVARRALHAVRSGDTVARLGGDEFAILVEQSTQPLKEARLVANRLLEVLTEPVSLGNRSVVMTASIGIAAADEGSTAAEMLRDADTAMYRAKSSGKARWVEYEVAMRAAAVQRLQIESDLLGALEGEQFRIEYQPVIALRTGRVTGFEALLRWTHPTLGEIGPDVFIPIAEETGLIGDIGRWVLVGACRQAAAWRRRFGRHLTMAVNVSGRQLADPELVEDVRRALTTAGLPAAALVLEITETTLIEDSAFAGDVLEHLRDLGVRLAVDDFGTGYSSLTHLQQFPVDVLKIDRSFVSIVGDEVPAIVRGLLDLASTLGLQTVAEGIESPEQLQQLRALDCDDGQGFLFARSLSPAAAEVLLEEGAVPTFATASTAPAAPTGATTSTGSTVPAVPSAAAGPSAPPPPPG